MSMCSRTSAFSVPHTVEVCNGGGARSEHARHSSGCHGIRSQPRDKPDRVDPDTVAAARLWEAATEVFSCEPGPSSSAEQQHDRVAALEPARGTSDQPTAQTSWAAAICTRRSAVCSTAQAAGLVGAARARAWPPIERVGHLLVAPRPGPGPRHQACKGGPAPREGGLPPSHRVREQELLPEVRHPDPCCCCSAGARAPGVHPSAGSLVP